jgi:hypothetical protein
LTATHTPDNDIMKKLTRDDLLSLEQYSEQRPDFRAQVLVHKKDRKVHIGPTATLYFEDRMTMQYQIQEMLRVERIFEASGIEEELSAYNPLIPDGSNWKATFMIEEPDVEKRQQLLASLMGIEDRVWVRIDGNEQVFAIADEDMDRDTEEKTSAVHFMRFELSEKMAADLKQGAALGMGIGHKHYAYEVEPVAGPIRESLLADLD